MHDVKIPEEHLAAIERRRGTVHVFADFDPAKTALIVIDMQNTFVAADGLVGAEGAREKGMGIPLPLAQFH